MGPESQSQCKMVIASFNVCKLGILAVVLKRSHGLLRKARNARYLREVAENLNLQELKILPTEIHAEFSVPE